MGELLICHEAIAAMPFYVEEAGINLYSMEELCYYIAGNTYLLGDSFMGEELCTWIEHQMGLYKLAEDLRSIHSISEFAEAILKDTGYYSAKEREEIISAIRQMEEKTDFECKKLRADLLMENRKYISAIYEYRKLLDSEDPGKSGAVLTAAIWYNLGTAYARLFLFQEAVRCYEKSYELNPLKEAVRAVLLCCLCAHDEQEFLSRAQAHYVDETGREELRKEYIQAQNGEAMEAFRNRRAEIMGLEEAGEKLRAKQAVTDMIFGWKEEYRKSSRM